MADVSSGVQGGRASRHPITDQAMFRRLIATGAGCIWSGMILYPPLGIDLQDRARLRERFFGAARTVLARP
jgi:hypothetical protein